jgi:hypothetical protein
VESVNCVATDDAAWENARPAKRTGRRRAGRTIVREKWEKQEDSELGR